MIAANKLPSVKQEYMSLKRDLPARNHQQIKIADIIVSSINPQLTTSHKLLNKQKELLKNAEIGVLWRKKNSDSRRSQAESFREIVKLKTLQY